MTWSWGMCLSRVWHYHSLLRCYSCADPACPPHAPTPLLSGPDSGRERWGGVRSRLHTFPSVSVILVSWLNLWGGLWGVFQRRRVAVCCGAGKPSWCACLPHACHSEAESPGQRCSVCSSPVLFVFCLWAGNLWARVGVDTCFIVFLVFSKDQSGAQEQRSIWALLRVGFEF